MKPEITLIYDSDCPNVGAARAALNEALARSGVEHSLFEVERGAASVPRRFSEFGSPTILVNGADVAGEPDPAAASCCRIYQTNHGLRAVPPVEAIVAAIDRAEVAKGSGGTQMSKATASGALGLAFASSLGWLCCLPFASGAFGIGLATIAAVMGPWWPMLATGSLVLLILAIVQAVRGRGGLKSDHCDTRNHARRQWIFVSVVGLLTAAFLTLPWWSAEITYRLIR